MCFYSVKASIIATNRVTHVVRRLTIHFIIVNYIAYVPPLYNTRNNNKDDAHNLYLRFNIVNNMRIDFKGKRASRLIALDWGS